MGEKNEKVYGIYPKVLEFCQKEGYDLSDYIEWDADEYAPSKIKEVYIIFQNEVDGMGNVKKTKPVRVCYKAKAADQYVTTVTHKGFASDNVYWIHKLILNK